MFGFAQSFWFAILSRSLFGLLNGNMGVYKTYLGEITDDTNRPKAFGVIGLTVGIGIVTGPLIGGFLARPYVLYRNVTFLRQFLKPGGILQQFPYILPNLFISSFCLIGFIVGLFALTESNQNIKKKKSETIKEKIKKFFNSEILKGYSPLASCVIYCLIGMSQTGIDEVLPLWILLPPPYGLAFTTMEIGILVGLCGTFIILIQIFAYKPLVNKIGLLWTFRIGAFFSIFVIPIVDTSYLYDIKWLAWIILIIGLCIRILHSQFCLTSIFVIINNTVTPESMGTLNGIAQSMVALTKAITPFTMASLFAWSLDNDLPFPFDKHFVFILCVSLSLIALFLSFFLSRDVNYSKDAKKDKTDEKIEMEDKESNNLINQEGMKFDNPSEIIEEPKMSMEIKIEEINPEAPLINPETKVGEIKEEEIQ